MRTCLNLNADDGSYILAAETTTHAVLRGRQACDIPKWYRVTLLKQEEEK